MNIVVTHVYSSRNNGDAAILSAQLQELKRTFPKAHLSILSVDDVRPGHKFEGVPVYSSLMQAMVSPRNNRLKKLVLSFVMTGYTLAWGWLYRLTRLRLPLPHGWRHPIDEMVAADLVVCVGGGYLRAKNDISSSVVLMLLFHQIWLAKTLRKPVVLYAQSFGPYPRELQLAMAIRTLKTVDFILVREAQSKALLKALEVPQHKIVKVPDSAFMARPPVSRSMRRKLFGIKNSKDTIVGVTVRDWLPGPQQAAYEQAIANFIDFAVEHYGFKVVVIAQVTSVVHKDDDREPGKRISKLVTAGDNVIFLNKRFNHHDIQSVYGSLDYLVGTRFHSVIFGLTAGVPAIAIEYEHKTSGIMQDLNLNAWTIPIENVTSQRLEVMFSRLVNGREHYLDHLHQVLPPYISAAYSSGPLIKSAYERFQAGDAAVRK